VRLAALGNLGEFYQGEVPRSHLLGSRVNKGKKRKGRNVARPGPLITNQEVLFDQKNRSVVQSIGDLRHLPARRS
jgi:hypothetical protein